MVKISVKVFALTGTFGPVTIGMSKEHVLSLLGKPDGDVDLGFGGTDMQYGRYEFFFDKTNKLTAIQNDNCSSDYPELAEYRNDVFQVEPWVLRSPPAHTLESVRTLLTEENIAFKVIEEAGRSVIELPSKVFIDFDDEKKESPIVGVRFFPERRGTQHSAGG